MTDAKRDTDKLKRLANYFNPEKEMNNNSEDNIITEPIKKEEKRDIAIHESSHVVIAYKLNVRATKTSIKSLDENGTGITKYYDDDVYSGNHSKEIWAKFALAGPIGEREYNSE